MMTLSSLNKLVCAFALAVGMLGVAGFVAAGTIGPPVGLDQLLGPQGGPIQVEDKFFDNFAYSWTGDMPTPDNVTVAPFVDDDGNYGIQVQGAFGDSNATQGGSDALVQYTVEVTDPEFFITMALIDGNPNLLGTTGSVSVTETFRPLGDVGEFVGEIYDDGMLGTQMMDMVNFNGGHFMLSVQKDIHAIAGDGDATLSFVNQTFKQEPVPEPAAALLLLIGTVLPLGLSARRRSA